MECRYLRLDTEMLDALALEVAVPEQCAIRRVAAHAG